MRSKHMIRNLGFLIGEDLMRSLDDPIREINSLAEVWRILELDVIQNLLLRCHYNQSEVARRLGMSRSKLIAIIKNNGLISKPVNHVVVRDEDLDPIPKQIREGI